MEIEKGTILIAKDVCKMNQYHINSLIIGKEYPIIDFNLTECFIKSEVWNNHYFLLNSLHEYFYIKEMPKVERYILTYSDFNTIFDNYDLALEEAKKLAKEQQSTVLVCKAITELMLNDIKINNL